MNQIGDDATGRDVSGDVNRDGGAQPERLVLRSTSPEQTRELGSALGRLLTAGDVVLLVGELGAGKTAFTQGIGAGLGVVEAINSPTFTLVKEYDGAVRLYHFDLYRIEDPEELYALGFEEYFGGKGVAVVEWAERGEDDTGEAVWPTSWVRATLRATGPDKREIELTAAGERGRALLAAFAQGTPAARTRRGVGQGATKDASTAGERA